MLFWPSTWSRVPGLEISWNISASPIIKGSPTPKARGRKRLTIKWLGEIVLVHKTELLYKIPMSLFVPFGMYKVQPHFFSCSRPCGRGCWEGVMSFTVWDSISVVSLPSMTPILFLPLPFCSSSPQKITSLLEGLSFTPQDTLEFTCGKREKIIEIKMAKTYWALPMCQELLIDASSLPIQVSLTTTQGGSLLLFNPHFTNEKIKAQRG